jgi:hypothetical protein
MKTGLLSAPFKQTQPLILLWRRIVILHQPDEILNHHHLNLRIIEGAVLTGIGVQIK